MNNKRLSITIVSITIILLGCHDKTTKLKYTKIYGSSKEYSKYIKGDGFITYTADNLEWHDEIYYKGVLTKGDFKWPRNYGTGIIISKDLEDTSPLVGIIIWEVESVHNKKNVIISKELKYYGIVWIKKNKINQDMAKGTIANTSSIFNFEQFDINPAR
ncbi:MAG: hypothetical protein WC071_13000 [Victivallaceae bacterium]